MSGGASGSTSSGGVAGSGGVAAGASGGGAGGAGGSGGNLAGNGGGGSGGAAVDLPDGVTDLFPLPEATNTCPDPPLRLSFSGAPTLGTSGSVKVFDASAPGTPVASVDFAAMTITDTIGGLSFNLQRPIYVDGNDVVVNLKSHALGYGKTYFVTVDAGAVKRTR